MAVRFLSSPQVPMTTFAPGHAASSKKSSAKVAANFATSTASRCTHYAWNLSRGKTNDWEKGKGDAVQFDPVDWYELLREGYSIESMVEGHWQVMDEFDPEHHIKLVVDEWGPWYRPGSEATPGDILEQMPTLRDAVFSGMTLDIFQSSSGEKSLWPIARSSSTA